MPKINEIHADVFADLDDIAETKADEFKNRFVELLENPKRRNPALWKKIGALMDLVTVKSSELTAASKGNLDLVWRIQVAGLWAACRMQAMVEILIVDVLLASNEGKKKMNAEAAKMDKAELKSAAVAGTSKDDFKAARDRRKIGKTV